MPNRRRVLLSILLIALPLGACGEAVDSQGSVEEDDLAALFRVPAEPIVGGELGKGDTVEGTLGLDASVLRLHTEVWDVRHDWDDRTSPEARRAGLAWGEDSGLSWEEKFIKWHESFRPIEAATQSELPTFSYQTPWGREMAAPSLECAEIAVFLRIAFASWYGLPFMMQAHNAEHGRVHFGHFGMYTSSGPFPGRSFSFAERYLDHRPSTAEILGGQRAWPEDARLRAKRVPTAKDDAQPMIGPDAFAGAYMDEVFLNKRVGHFALITLAYFGSINLASTANTFNATADSVRVGDVLVKRWQERGTGHAMIVMKVNPAPEHPDKIEAEVASGSIPRRQPEWESFGSSRADLIVNTTGGESPFYELGGGLKRWRAPELVGNKWVNAIPRSQVEAWVNYDDEAAITARPARFDEILRPLNKIEKRDVLERAIEKNRKHLQKYPSSCSARTRREEAFVEFYEFMESEFGMTRAEVDRDWREPEDYIFAELDYARSKTCCWNGSSRAMYEIIIEHHKRREAKTSQCVAPMVFMNRDDGSDGYEIYRQVAISMGRGDQWADYSNDERCDQGGVSEDTPKALTSTPYCAAFGDDPVEPGQGASPVTQFSLVSGTISIPDADPFGLQFFATVESERPVQSVQVAVRIDHPYDGDLVIRLTEPGGFVHRLKGTSREGRAGLDEVYEVEFDAPRDASGTWMLEVADFYAPDAGAIERAALSFEHAE